MAFCAIDPGKKTGIAIFNKNGKLLTASSLIDNEGLINYIIKLQKIRDSNNIQFAIIERYAHFANSIRKNAHKVESQIRACQEVFKDHILVYASQWNPRKYKVAMKRQIYTIYYGDKMPANEHEIDAVLIGGRLFLIASLMLEKDKEFEALFYLAQTKKEWPTKKQKSLYTLWGERRNTNSHFCQEHKPVKR